jgi:protein SPA2
MQGLLTELNELSRRNDELMTAKDSDLIVIRDLDQQMKEYKRKYEQAKTELRNLKGELLSRSNKLTNSSWFFSLATSQLFLQAPKQQIEDQLPFSPDGGVLDIHVTAFVSAIDSLLTAGRSNAPTRVLAPMKSIVNAVHAIIEDVRLYERRNSDADVEHLRSLRERADATLSNLMAAAKSHAQSSGMAPVSLLDAAASHVSATMTEIGKTVSVRKATKAEQEQFAATSPPLPQAPARTSYSPALRTVEEMRSSGVVAPSSTRSPSGSVSSIRRNDNNSPASQTRVLESPMAAARASPISRPSLEEKRRPPSGPSSSNGSSPPPIFDRSQGDRGVGSASEESAAPEGNEDAWAELKVRQWMMMRNKHDWFLTSPSALFRGTDRSDCVWHPGGLGWRTGTRTAITVEREFDPNHYDRFKHRGGVQR